jgi:hypothetical protein
MKSEIRIELAIELARDKGAVLAHVSDMRGVNWELDPFLQMTAPRSFTYRSLFEAKAGTPLFRSWLLLGGVLPIDVDHLALESIDPESGFVESSTMLAMASWRHERRVIARASGGSRLVDRIAFTPRIPGTGRVLEGVVEHLFRHRHSKLALLFGRSRGSR